MSIEIFRSNRPKGTAGLTVIRPGGIQLTAADLEDMARPKKGLSEYVNDWRSDNWKHNVSKRGLPEIRFAEKKHIPTLYGGLWLTHNDTELGLASVRVITNNGVAAIVNAFLNTFELENFKYHGLGTGTTAEAATDAALVTELTTAYNPDNTRATGTLASTAANIFQTVGTNNVDAASAITEHGVFSQAATGGGVLFDRSVFSAVNLAIGDGLQSDYRATFTAGG